VHLVQVLPELPERGRHHVVEEILRQAEAHRSCRFRGAKLQRGLVVQGDDAARIGDEGFARLGMDRSQPGANPWLASVTQIGWQPSLPSPGIA
jgi:hypothetical protein